MDRTQLSKNRQALFVMTDFTRRIAAGLQVAFDPVKFIDQTSARCRTTHLAFGLHFLRFYEFATCVGQAS